MELVELKQSRNQNMKGIWELGLKTAGLCVHVEAGSAWLPQEPGTDYYLQKPALGQGHLTPNGDSPRRGGRKATGVTHLIPSPRTERACNGVIQSSCERPPYYREHQDKDSLLPGDSRRGWEELELWSQTE